MAAFLLARILSLALHLTILGSLLNVDLQLHKGRLWEALIHTAVICVCILVLAITGYVATKLLSKSADNLRIDIRRVPLGQANRRRSGTRKRVVGRSAHKTKR